MSTPNIRPDRTNWRQFCQEQPLSTDEATEWRKMADAILADDTATLFDFIIKATGTEVKAEAQAEQATTKDWSDLVQEVDTSCRRKRAELVAWRQWREQEQVR